MPSVFVFQVGASSSLSSRTFSVRVDRVDRAHLALQELGEHLDVAHLVDHLRAGVELRVHASGRRW